MAELRVSKRIVDLLALASLAAKVFVFSALKPCVLKLLVQVRVGGGGVGSP